MFLLGIFEKNPLMKFQVGDKVKFLNTKGGGVVSRIISPSLVNVMTEDGFEIPTLTSELIKVSPEGKVESMFDEDFTRSAARVRDQQQRVAAAASDKKKEESGEKDRQSPLGNFSFLAKNTPGVYIAFVPHDQKWLVTGTVEIYLVNHTSFSVLFSFFLEREKEILGKDYDVIFPGNKILLDAIDRDELLGWTRGIVQMLFHEEQPIAVFLPVSADFDISPARLNREENYVATQFLEEKALVVSLAQVSSLHKIISKEESHLSEEVLMKQQAMAVRPGSMIERHQTGLHEAVVDLHIEELEVDHSRLSPHEILRYQMDYFNRCIESAADKNFKKVTFIHGVGNGSLKNAIIKRLQEYEHVESHLASLAKFGVGAIDVTIKPFK